MSQNGLQIPGKEPSKQLERKKKLLIESQKGKHLKFGVISANYYEFLISIKLTLRVSFTNVALQLALKRYFSSCKHAKFSKL